MPSQPLDTPLLVFDGDCHFCRQWVGCWQRVTGDRVRYESYQTVAWRYPEVSDREFAQSIQYFEKGKQRKQGADAVFHALAWGKSQWKLLAYLYDHVSIFAAVSECLYQIVARHRSFFSLLTQWTFGNELNPAEFSVGMRLFIKGLALIFFLAFLSYWIQFPGLVGSEGILPASRFFDEVGQMPEAVRIAPSLCWWLGAGDTSLSLLCGIGALLSLFALCGFWEAPIFLSLYVLYVSLCTAGQIFYLFQWDSLLLEAGVVAALGASWKIWTGWRAGKPSRIAHFLVLWLLFRLMFASGMTKWLHGSKEWRDFTALKYHYLTQPLPTPLAWYAYQLPDWFQHFSVGLMFLAEVFLPFLLFAPGRFRLIAAIGIAVLQIAIAATGNYGFFNFLSILLCIAAIEDRWWPIGIRRALRGGSSLSLPQPVLVAACGALIILGLGSMNWMGGICQAVFPAYSALRPFQLSNGYGLFVQMTTSRHEIHLEGSKDGFLWKAYTFRYKPGALSQPPPWIAPYMPRLDWMMWFAALGRVEQNPWFGSFMVQLLRGSPSVLALLASNPFPSGPPTYLRASLDKYDFTTRSEGYQGDWWKSQPLGYYVNQVRLARHFK
ncbi:MAG: membrane protein [Verrucomicrobia bacterium]|nr:MAG: membrane protein [Verrucomicrobiota bacterium]